MNGKNIDSSTVKKLLIQAQSACGGEAYTNQQISATKSVSNTTLDPNGIAFPCGQRAKSYLKIKPEIDSIKLYNNGTQITLNR